MAQTPDDTRREIEKTRLRIAAAVDELEGRIEESKDWRKQIRTYPLESVLIAFGIGFTAIMLAGAAVRRVFSLKKRNGRALTEQAPRRGFNVESLFKLTRPIITKVLTTATVTYMRRKGATENKNK